MHTLATLVLLLAFIVFVLAALGISSRVNLVATGLALWVLSQLVVIWR
jgi:hypothetical protein